MNQKTLRNLALALIALSVIVVVAVLVTARARDAAGGDATVQVLRNGNDRGNRDTARPRDGRVTLPEHPEKGQDPAKAGESQEGTQESDPSAARNPGTSDRPTSASAAMGIGQTGPGNAAGPGLDAQGNPLNADGSKATDGSTAGSTSGAVTTAAAAYQKGDEDAPPDASEDAVTVGGRVLRGDQPVEGGVIVLSPANGGGGRTVWSKPDGTYLFRGVNPANYSLVLQRPPSSLAMRFILINPKEDRLSEDFIIPGQEPVKGIVVNAADGEALAGVHLDVLSGSRLLGSTYTDAQGNFTLFPLEPGNYSVSGEQEGFLPGEQAFQVPQSGTAEAVRLSLEPTGSLKGVVLDPQGVAIAGARVSLFGSSVFNDPFASLGARTTDGSGRFSFTAPNGTMSGAFRAGALHDGYVGNYSQAYVSTEMPSGQQITVQLRPGAVVTGRVISAEEEPLDGVDVRVTQGFASTGALFQRFTVPYPRSVTGADGRFKLEGVEPGQTTLTFAGETFVSADHEFTVTEGTFDVGDITLEDSEETKKGRIFGIILDESSTPMVNHFVLFREVETRKDYSARTDSRGGFSKDDLPEGKYTILTNGSLLRGDIYIVMDQQYPWATPGGDKIYLIYDMAQAIRMKVVDTAGEPVRNFKVGVKVRKIGSTGFGGAIENFGLAQERSFQTSDGVAVMENLLAGPANITIAADNVGSDERTNVTIPVNGTLDLGTVTLASGVTVTGTVLGTENGYAISGVLVRAEAPVNAPASHPLNQLQFETRTDSAGQFRIKGIPAGDFILRLSKPGRVTRLVTKLTAEADKTLPVGKVNMEVAAVLQGVIVNPQGQPLVDVQIRVGETILFTDQEGKFYNETLATGQVRLYFHDPTQRYTLGQMDVVLMEGTPLILNLTMQPKVE